MQSTTKSYLITDIVWTYVDKKSHYSRSHTRIDRVIEIFHAVILNYELLYAMILTFELGIGIDNVKMNEHARCLCQMSSNSNVIFRN